MNDEMMMMNLGIRVERRVRRMAIPVSVPMNVMMMMVVVVVAVGGGNAETSPRPKAWPEQFHALLVSNNTKTLKLQVIDLWYDWPKGRNLNLIQDQLGKKLHDVEWNNGTSFYYTLGGGGGGGGGGGDGLECRTIHFEVGILRPNWLEGAIYLGQRQVDGFLCNGWYKADFIWYYEDVVSNRPVHWLFYTGMAVHVMTFEVGAVLEDSHWQAPAHCFHADLRLNNNNNNNTNNLQPSSSSSSVIDAHLPLLRHTGTSSSSSSSS